MPPKKSRFNAFDDFPAQDAVSPAPFADEPTPLPLPGKVTTQQAPSVERIERLKPSEMLPDRYQPRRLLPPSLRAAFFRGEIDCYTAAREWLEMAKADSGIKTETDRLLMMGESFKDHGQIKPITGSWQPASDGSFIFVIETGERRFWASCLQFVANGQAAEPQLRVEVVANPTRQRQVLENRHAEPPSAVEQSCEVASLILAELGVTPDPNNEDEFEYFRQARAQRMPAGLWDRITPVMQLTRPRMVQLLNILQFPSPLLDLADRYRLPERVLREVLLAPREQWERALRMAVTNQLTSDEVAEMTAQQPLPAEPARKEPVPAPPPGKMDPSVNALKALRRFAYTISNMDSFDQSQALDEIADTLIVTRQAEGVLVLLEELSRLIDARLKRK